MQKYEIKRGGGRCVKTNRELSEGEEYYVVLFEEGEGFRREDYSLEAWDAPPDGAFCHFRSRIPVKEKKKRLLVDDELLINFFVRLADDEAPLRLRFRFVLALLLMRKRILKYEETHREGDAETWRMCLVKDKSTHSVLNPRLTDDEIEGVSRQLGAILHSDMGAFDDEESEDEGTEGRRDQGERAC